MDEEQLQENSPDEEVGSLESGVSSTGPAPMSENAQEEISKSDIKTMEVHHHPEVEKKGFKEYLLEGLMIFIAVMMGFFAESLRENISEKRIEKEFIESFVADLKKDTATFNIVIPMEATAISGLDSMLAALSHGPYTDSSIRFMYYLSRKYTESIEPMSYTLRTITQLKYAGGLRLISNKNASDSIVRYNKMVDDVASILNYTTHDFMVPSIRLGNKIFNAKFFLPYNAESVIDLLHSGQKMNLLTNEEAILSEYMSLIYEVKQIRQDYFRQLQRHKERAIDMISFFEKEYHLENE